MPTINPVILLVLAAVVLFVPTVLVLRSRRSRRQVGAAVPAQYRRQPATNSVPPERLVSELMDGLHPAATVTPTEVRKVLASQGAPLKVCQVRSLLERDDSIVGQDHTALRVNRRTPNRRRYRPAAQVPRRMSLRQASF